MKKLCFFCGILFLCFCPFPLCAVELVSLEINEALIVGPELIPLTVTGVLSNGQTQQIRDGLVWQTSDPQIANVTAGGTLYFSGKEGTVTLSVYKGKASGQKTVYARPWPLSLSIEGLLAYSEQPYRLLLQGKFSDGTTHYYGPEEQVIWSSSNPWVAWVNREGVVTFTGEEGNVRIRATAGAYSDFVETTITAEREVTVWPTGIKIKEKEILYAAQPQQLALLLVYHDGTEEEITGEGADWSTDNPAVVYVDATGKVAFTGQPGLAMIRVSYGGFHDECLVSVGRFLKEITLNQSLNYTAAWDKQPLPLSVTATYNDGSVLSQTANLLWETDNQEIAEITETGVLTFTGEPGQVKITVSGSGGEGNIVQDELVVAVPAKEGTMPQRLYIAENPLGGSSVAQPGVFCVLANGEKKEVTQEVQWTSLTPQTASIYEGTIYFSPLPGPLKITARYQGLTDTLTGYNYGLAATVKPRICQVKLQEHYALFSFAPTKLTALALWSDGTLAEINEQLRWHSSQPAVAQVDQQGILTFSGWIGKTTISVQGFGFRDFLEIEVRPEDLKPRVTELVLEGDLTRGHNQLRAIAYFNNGTSQDVTADAVWNTTNKNKVLVTEQGSVMFLGEFAPVTISAHFGGQGAVLTRT